MSRPVRKLEPAQQIERELLIAEREMAYAKSKRLRRLMSQMIARRRWRP